MLWIDAICIDQGSINERNHQVAFMGEIYRNCQNVVIWLGDEDHETESVLAFIKSTFEEIEQSAMERPQYRNLADLTHLYISNLVGHMTEKLFRSELIAGCRRLERFLQRPWWTRAWIVQEFANAPDATFRVGDFSINWILVSVVIIVFFKSWRIREFGVCITTVNDADSLIYTRLVRQKEIGSKLCLYKMGYSFMILLRGQSYRKCSDPRDKVFSILSMTSANILKILPPDYSKSVLWTYITAVRTYIKISKSLDILGCNTEEPPENYPSWCPSWNKQPRSQTLNINPAKTVNKASGTTEAVATFSKDESTIYLERFLICTIVDNCFQDTQKHFTYQEHARVQSN